MKTQTPQDSATLTLLVDDGDLDAFHQKSAGLLAVWDGEMIDRFSVDEDGVAGLLEAATIPSLFGAGRRKIVVDGIEALDVATAEMVVSAAGYGNADMVLRAAKSPSKAVMKRFTDAGFDVIVCKVRGRRDVAARISEIAHEYGVTLDRNATEAFAERAGERLPAVRGACEKLAAVGVYKPSAAQIAQLLGGLHNDVAPWELWDAIRAGDAKGAIGVLDRAARPPVVAAVGISRSIRQAAQVAEAGIRTGNEAAKLLGIHAFPAGKVVADARVVGQDIPWWLQEALRVELDARRPDAARWLERNVCAIATRFSASC